MNRHGATDIVMHKHGCCRVSYSMCLSVIALSNPKELHVSAKYCRRKVSCKY